MSNLTPALRQSSRKCSQRTCNRQMGAISRTFTSAVPRHDSLETQPSSTDASIPPPSAPAKTRGINPNLVSTPRLERKLWREQRKMPIGSRRRRAALTSTSSIPFEQLPYQCFQEARKVLIADREEKVKQIEVQRARIQRLRDQDVTVSGGERQKETRLKSMNTLLEELKVFADVNDPLVKKRHEDGQGDMNKPIYRYYANKDWQAYRRKVLIQRITQMAVVPDVLPSIDPTVDLTMSFRGRKAQPGAKLLSSLTAQPPVLNAQVFDAGKRLYTVVVIDSDVPDLINDGFGMRCHGIFTNFEVEPTKTTLDLSKNTEGTVLSWLAPHAMKGSPYHRLSILLLQHPLGTDGQPMRLNPEACQKFFPKRDGLNLRSIMDKLRVNFTESGKGQFQPVGVTLFRTEWDEDTERVMRSAGIEGWDMEFKNEKPQKLPYKKKDGARYR